MKQCVRCLIEKPLDQFGNNKNSKDGKSSYCKECERLRGIEYRNTNRKKVNESAKNWRSNNPENYKKTIEKYLEKNPNMVATERVKVYRQDADYQEKEKQRSREYYKNNLEEMREKNKKYYHKNKKNIIEKNNKWKVNKRKTDGFYRMKLNLRHRLRDYLFGESKGKRTMEIVGLDKKEFKLYIQSKFTEGMSWENYGKWHLDHIKPLCQAKDNNDALLLNHYTNLQPLWAEENLKKNRKL